MIKQDIITAVAETTGQSEYAVRITLEATIDIVKRAIQSKEKVVIRGFGTFNPVVRNPRTARNPRTGEPVYINKRTVVVFEPGQDLRKL